MPTFVAKNLNRLPPVSFDHVDVTRLLKDIVILKSELNILRQDTISKSELKQFQSKISSDINDLKQVIGKSSTYNRPQQKPNEQGNTGENSTKNRTPKRPATTIGSRHATDDSTPRAQSPPKDEHTPSYRDLCLRSRPPPRRNASSTLVDSNSANSGDKDENSFTLVERKKKRPPAKKINMRGTATGSIKLQAADMPASIYLSRLKKTISKDDIKEYIHEKGESCIDVQSLQQRDEVDFKSYKIVVLKDKLNIFLEKEFWPSGIIFRRFRERITNVVNKKS
ncbi:hypothetical protein O0L34_g15466 [Tuta absoluta]|nr:hypothetical protein O0L34_g15466 [Tuta absoluta]